MLKPHASPPGRLSRSVVARFLGIFLPAALLPGCVVLALYYHDLANDQTLYEQAGAHLVDLHTEMIGREVRSVESDLLFLADQAVLRDFLSGRQASKQELQGEYLLFCRHKGLYDQIRYLDATGQEVIRINHNGGQPVVVPESELQPKAGRYYFAQTWLLGRGEVFVSPFDLNVEYGQIEQPIKPVIRFATPVFDQGGAKRGVLILNYLGAALIDKLAEASRSFPGQTYLLNEDGFFLRGPQPADEWGFLFGNQRTFASYYPDAWPSLEQADHGQLHTSAGLFTFRTLSPQLRIADPDSQMGYENPQPAIRNPQLLKVVSQVPPNVLFGRATQFWNRLLLLYGVVLVLVVVLAGYLAYAGALRRSHERRIEESEARLRALSSQLLTAQEDERRSLSRDLHDELGQVVTAVTLNLQRAAQTGDREKAEGLLRHALHGAECLLERIHEISSRLRPSLLDDLGLKDAVQSLVSDYERRTGIVVRAELRFEHDAVPPAVSANVYRILQEALTNVAKHAKAPAVSIELGVTDRHVTLVVRDAGVGFARETVDGEHLGLLGMRERAELLGGSFVVKSQPGQGTEIGVQIPLAKP
jgi:signal transduction histidine kinase